MAYFSIQRFKISAKDSRIEHRIQKEFRQKDTHETPFDFIYHDTPMEDMLAMYKGKIHNDSMILVSNIHSTKETSALWQTTRKNETVTVSLDLFHCGVLFVRKEQVKEHFKIRI